MASEDARYRQSTQYRLWSFSPAQLAATREKTNALARANISETLLSKQQSSSSSSSNGNGNPNNAASAVAASAPASGANTPDAAAAQALPDFLTPAEELQLLNWYTIQLIQACNFLELRTDFRATAAVFLRRFYVTNSIMTYPPTEMLKTCLFFGCKAEGYYASASKFAENFPQTTGEQILAGEFLLCQGLRFAFDVKHPFRALEGAIMELRRYGDLDDKRISSAHSRARDILKFSALVTDVYFHYTPSQIMLAALSLADRDLADRVINETFHHHQPPHPTDHNTTSKSKPLSTTTTRLPLLSAETRDRVTQTIHSCRDVLAREPPERLAAYWSTPESTQITKPLLRKLKKCRDPDRWDLVAYQAARREQALSRRRQKDGPDNGDGDGDGGEDGDGEGRGLGDGAAVFGDALLGGGGGGGGHDVKRRKVAAKLDDPFGGPL